MIIQACLCPALWNKSNDGFCWVYKSLERNRTNKSKKIRDIHSHGTIGTNVTKGVSMIIQACLCPALWNKSNDGF